MDLFLPQQCQTPGIHHRKQHNSSSSENNWFGFENRFNSKKIIFLINFTKLNLIKVDIHFSIMYLDQQKIIIITFSHVVSVLCVWAEVSTKLLMPNNRLTETATAPSTATRASKTSSMQLLSSLPSPKYALGILEKLS